MNYTDIIRQIQDIRFAGEHPLLQYDALDSQMLYSALRADPYIFTPWRLAKILKSLGLRRLGVYSIEGWRVHLWTCLPPQPLDDVLALVAHRIRTNSTELHTEILIESGQPVPPAPPETLLTAFERDVLSLRLQRHPPRRIAAMLKTHSYEVYEASQRIRLKLHVACLKNLEELKEKATDASALMDDPAFF